MFDDRITVRLGAAVTVVMLALVALALRTTSVLPGKTTSFRVFMNHPGALRTTADVQLGGRVIGTVRSIRLVTTNEARRPEHLLFPNGGVLIDVTIQSEYLSWVRVNSEIFVNTKGLIGEAYLEIAPPPADEHMEPSVADRDAVRGVDPARMEHIIVTSFLNARRFGALLEEIQPSLTMLRVEIRSLRETLHTLDKSLKQHPQLTASLSEVSDKFSEFRSHLDSGGPSLSALYRQASALGKMVRATLSSLRQETDTLAAQLQRIASRVPGNMSEKFATASAQAKRSLQTFRGTLSRLEDLADKVNAGMGTIGALLNDEEFVDDRKKLGRYIKRHPWKFLTRPFD